MICILASKVEEDRLHGEKCAEFYVLLCRQEKKLVMILCIENQ